jgi:hypothetical protein
VAGPSARRARTSLRLRALDAPDRLSGRSGRLVPPRRLQFVGDGDFVGIGDEFLSHLVGLCGLRRVALRPGSWTGRADGLSFQDVVVARA